MQSTSIRDQFIQFFIKKGHQHVAAVPILSKEDPSLLFVNAGMNPFKDIILGHQPIAAPRVVSVQPCLRVSGKHNDLEAVGIDMHHHTLFEMLGNWSFGDYTKQEAIAWAWELLTQVYQLPKNRMYVTIFAGDPQAGLPKDAEAAAIWAHYLPPSHILPFSKKDNFWEMGAQGPCGPCSEIHIDLRSELDQPSIPATQLINRDHPHVLEIWNLVFMQYNRQADGQLVHLPRQHIDTGMGFERLTMALQGKQSTYDTDIFAPLIQKIEILSGKKYDQGDRVAIAMRVIADHIRAVAFAIADGQIPSNAKAGYVIRRILRRAIRYGYSHLGMDDPFIYQLVGIVVAQVADVYPHLSLQQSYIESVVRDEEGAFLKTLAIGLQLMHQLMCHQVQPGIIDGHFAFTLYDTHGFPLDLTLLIAEEKGWKVDEVGFQRALQKQKSRSQQDAVMAYGDWNRLHGADHSSFVGYDALSLSTTIVQWRTVTDKEGLHYQLVLEQTPFYPAGGGQVADKGFIWVGTDAIPVQHVQKEHGCIVHSVQRLPVPLTGPIVACVDAAHRRLVANNHTATHLLQAALQSILGDHVVQKGSLVTADALRFDFVHATKLSAAQIVAVESMVNAKIRANSVCTEQRDVPLAVAQSMGAQALFGEKYGAQVRVIAFDSLFSIELCGGTHVQSTGQIGLFKIVNEMAIGAGIRRIEAMTADGADHFVASECNKLATIAGLLNHPPDLAVAIAALVSDKKALHKQLIAYQAKEIEALLGHMPLEWQGDVGLVIQAVTISYAGALRQLALQYKAKYKKIFVVLATHIAGKVELVILISEALCHKMAINAHLLMQSMVPLIAGRGGGNAIFASAGGDDPAGIPMALEKARAYFIQLQGGLPNG